MQRLRPGWQPRRFSIATRPPIQQNPDIRYLGKLLGDVIREHGSEQLFDRLVAHGKLFEYLAYPNRSHAIRERAGTREHLYGSLADFLMRRVPAGAR